MTQLARDGYVFDRVEREADLARLTDEWLDLFERSGTQNPFAHPAWVQAWLRAFVPDERDRVIVTSRRDGRLDAVAPFYVRSYGLGPARMSALLLAGSSSDADPLTEMSEVLVPAETRRRSMRAVLNHLLAEHAGAYDWVGLALTPRQGWFDDEWMPPAWQRSGAFAMHKEVRAFVVLPLPSTWEELPLKRNLKEAVRRSKNRLAALAEAADVRFVEGDEIASAVDAIMRLHSERAGIHDHLEHDDYFDDEAIARFARDAATGLARTGHAAAGLVCVGGTPIAGRMLLRAGGGAFLSFSGSDPAHWSLGASTHLIVHCIKRVMAEGDTVLNFSLNPDGAKLRWSEDLELHNEFLLPGPSRRSQRAFSLFWQMRAGRTLKRHRAYQLDRHRAAERQRVARLEQDATAAPAAESAAPPAAAPPTPAAQPAPDGNGSGPTRRFSIICMSSLDWESDLPTNRQQIMRRSAQRGHQVLFVETGEFVGVQLLRLLRGPGRRSLWRRLVGSEQVEPNVRVRKALNVFPWGQRYRLSDRVNGWASGLAVRRAARCLPDPKVVWLYDPRATWALDHSGEVFGVYDCVDDYAEQASGARNRALIAAADVSAATSSRVVFATTTPLEARHRELNPRTHLVRNVGDFAHFSPAQDRAFARADLAGLPRPIYGFAGNFLPAKVDLRLLLEFASSIDKGTVVLAGPARSGLSEHFDRLAQLPNVHLVGAVPYDEMPTVVAAFDVALIPYVENEYTRSCFPLKLFEYLAAGKPVVATGLPELLGMEPDVVVAADLDEFLAAVRRAEELTTPEDVQRRIGIAARNTWDVRTERLLGLVAAEL